MQSEIWIAVEAPKSPLVEKTVELAARRIRERSGQAAAFHYGKQATTTRYLALDIRQNVGAQSFHIAREGGAGAWRVTGGDERGLLYGVGKFLRGCRLNPAGDGPALVYDGPAGTFSPGLPVRGMYFATHFRNFYHDAPVEQVERYVEDLALWGCNALSVWFDMHHYAGIDDPDAQRMIARLHAILKAANRVGMGAGLTTLANEAYHTSPRELRAEPFPHHYRVELCPSKPAGLDLILKWREEMLRAFADLDIEYLWIWPYDQGGCKCPDCAPWGGNGFLRNAEAVGNLVRRTLPGAKNVVSTWEFGYWHGDAEWEAFYKTMAGKPSWADYIMAEGHGDFPPYILRNGPPPHFPLLNFPEISMHRMNPWGGFGANLQPRRLQRVWDSARKYLAGGFPYSEGIYEDLNKAVCLQLYWNPDSRVEDIVREYAFELAPSAADGVREAIFLLEENMNHGIAGNEKLQAWMKARTGGAGEDLPLYTTASMREPGQPLALLDAAARGMPPAAAASWRWRMLWLRAALDAELSRSGGRATDATDAYFREICGISCAENAEWPVTPPSRQALARLLQS